MNKIVQYLNEHLLGEVSANKAIRQQFSRDASVLSLMPEIVVFPRVTNDIRKVARFTWQLAEKGHAMGMTVRGGGSDQTGAAIGKGLIINTSSHLNSIIHIGLKEKLVHVQPGVNFGTLQDTLQWHGLTIAQAPRSAAYSTVGGAIANNAMGQSGVIKDAISKLEVVLANGDLLETGRISKRELSQKKGLQTFEGEIYRKLDGLIEDNQALIDSIHVGSDNAGYASVAAIKDRDGSFDLTPLFAGSQGTLGIVSEIVLNADYFSKDQTIVVAVLDSSESARDAADAIKSLQPSVLETFDGALFDAVAKKGKQFNLFTEEAPTQTIGAVLYAVFNDFSDRTQAHKLKRSAKVLSKYSSSIITSADRSIEELQAIRDIASFETLSVADTESRPAIIDGAVVPSDRHEEFAAGIAELAHKHHVTLGIRTNVLTSAVYLRPTLQLGQVSEKQKVVRLTTEYAALVQKNGGIFIGEAGEGRLKATAAWGVMSEEEVALYEQVRLIFDPFGTLNPGVKQPNTPKQLAETLRSSYDTADFAGHNPVA